MEPTTPPSIHLLALVHLIFVALWGGVVFTETVMEVLPFRRPELHRSTILFHYWTDLLVELPIILGVLATGALTLARSWPPGPATIAKIACAGGAVAANLTCIALVVRRRRLLDRGADDAALRRSSKTLVLLGVVGMPLAAVAAGLGFWLASQRMAHLLAGILGQVERLVA